MKITRENYEVFLIDYIDGNLAEESTQDLELFLESNPDIKEEMEGLQNYCLTEEEVEFPHKNDLLYTEYGVNETDRLLVGELERDLSQEEEVRLAELKKNRPELERDAKLFSFTKLKADLSVRFGPKENLKRKQITMSFWSYAAAASVILAVTSGIFFLGNDSANNSIATNGNQSIQSEVANLDGEMVAEIEEAPELAYRAVASSISTNTLLPKCFAAPVKGKLIRTTPKNVFNDVNSYLDSISRSYSYTVMGE